MPAALDELFPRSRIKRAAADLAHWGCDWTRAYQITPSAVVFPESIDEVVALVRLANAEALSLVPSGGRTGLSGGAVAGFGEVVVSFDHMNHIRDFSPADQLVTCEAGVVTETLQTFARERDLFYPVDFASAGSSQLGGNIATNAGGIKVIRYGLTRDWVAGLTVVTGAGEVLELNQGLVKNATGYDLRHLFIGSEGTLGFIVSAQMRLIPAPPPTTVMVLGLTRFADILEVLAHFQSLVTLTAFEFFSELALTKVLAHRDVQRPFTVDSGARFYALLEFDEAQVDEASAGFAYCVDQGWVVDGVLSQSQTQAAALWVLREGISESLAAYSPYKNDISVRIGDMPEFITDVDGLIAANYPDFEVCWYGHIGDGNLHINILKPGDLPQDQFFDRCHEISPRLFAQVAQRHGSISAEHGVGLLKKDFLGFSRSPAEIAVMTGIKRVLDPNGIMNPGKLL